MKVLIDSKSLQAHQHLEDKKRLSALITALISARPTPFCLIFSSPSKLTNEVLKECDVLIITTRWRFQHPGWEELDYSRAEIASIVDFVQDGGGLLLMSNHRPCHQFDAKLAEKFDVKIEPTHFQHREEERTVLCGSDLNSGHRIIAGASDKERVRCIITNTCCSIVTNRDRGIWIARLSSEMVDKQNLDRPPTDKQFFAHALDSNSGLSPECKGRIVTIADSGFIGTDCTVYPGPGLIGFGDNLRFIKNVIRWLGGELV